MRYLDKRVERICDELYRLRIVQRIPLTDLICKKGTYIRPEAADAATPPWTSFDSRSMHWYGPDEHYWFRTEFTVPKALDGKAMWLNVRTQIEGDDGKNPQFLLFVNNVPVQGMDMNHRDVLLSPKATAGEKLVFDLQAYTGTIHNEFNLFMEIQEIDPEIEALYYDLKVPVEAFSRMEKEDRNRMLLENALNEGINLLDLRTPYSEEFYASVRAASAYLKKAVYTDLAGHDDVIASCIGHTHIDVAWLWTVAQTREKTARSFATVLKLMDEYPNYHFMSSQPQLYYFLKERYPELYARLKERVKEKRWEPEGGMWLEADCNLTSGESLVRQFIHGKRFFREEFGVDNRILWLPDVFGYSGALPQIMKKSGIDYFMTTKLSWNQFNEVPFDTFEWRGIDGSEVLTHFITTLSIGQNVQNFFTTYNGMLHPDAIMGGWERYQNKDINNDILIAYGYGDGGGGPTRDMLETSKRMEKGVLSIPKVRQVFARQYFDELNERVKDSKRLPTWEGELYFEYHRGTYTSMARNKRGNRKTELGLMDLELLSVLAAPQLPYPAEALDSLWKNTLLNQFHDILPGTAIHEVYEQTKKEYDAMAETISALSVDRMQAIAPQGEGITVFNTTGKTRNDIVVLENCTANALSDGKNTYPVQKTENGAVAFLPDLPPKGYKCFAPVEAGSFENPLHIDGSTITTPFYTVEFNESGLITRLYDRKNDRETVQPGKYANLMRMYEDKPMHYDNWDIDCYYTEKFWDVTDVQRMEWTERGPVRATLEIERKVSRSVICQKIHFYATCPRIDFETTVDWKEHQHLLKAHFPMDVHTDEATFEIQFGNVTRKTHQNTSWDQARFESCGQKWIDVSEGHYGISLLNDCKYGHSVHNGEMALTLIKSGTEPNPVADQEMHVFTYALYPHAETWRGAETVAQAYFLNQPTRVTNGGTAGETYSLASVDAKNVILETVKQAEDGDGVIVRLYECENARTTTKLHWNRPIASVTECDLQENALCDVPVEDGTFKFIIKPYEIKTFRIR